MRYVVARLRPHARTIGLAAGGLVVALILFSLATGSGDRYTVKAQFEDVRGLIPGASVRAAAVTVGKVEKVDLVGTRPVVTMKVDKDYVLHEGAAADIQLFSNAGAVNRTIELTSGDPSKPRLPAGTVLKAPQTDQPVNFDDASETLNAPTRDNIRSLLGGLDAALKGRGKDVDRTLRRGAPALNETANLLAQVNSDGAALKTLVRQGSRVMGALAASPGDLAGSADATASLLSVTARRQQELGRSVQLLGPSLARGRTALATLAASTPRLRDLVAGLAPVATELRPFARALPPALRAGVPFLGQTRQLVADGPRYLQEISPIITSAQAIGPQLGSTIRQILPLGNALRAYIPETVGFFQNLGSTLGTYDANGHILTLDAGLFQTPPSSTLAAQNGPGDCTPGQLKLPYTRLPGALECQPWADYEKSSVGVRNGGR